MVTTLGSVSTLTGDYAEIARRALEAERCALIVVDIQEKLLPPIFEKAQLLKNSQLLIHLAGILKIPALVTTQYAKGLAHLVIMVLLILGVSSDLPWYVITVLGIAIGFFYVYQIIDAVRSAKAIQLGEPAPDPFGLAQTFGAGEKFEGTKVPAGAAVLIGPQTDSSRGHAP